MADPNSNDLSQYSDEDLDRAIASAMPAAAPAKKKAPMTPQDLSDEELDALIAKHAEDKPPGFLKSTGLDILHGLAWVGNKVDSVTGAPTRAAISSLQDGHGLGDAAAAFKSQFAEDPETAPTGKAIAQKMGVPDTALSDKFPGLYSKTGDEWLKFKKGGFLDPTASGAVGLGIDVAADPTMYIPVTAIAEAASKGVTAGGRLAAEGVGKGLAYAGEKVAEGAAKVAPRTTAVLGASYDAVKNIKERLLKNVSPEIRPEFAKDVEVAVNNGIDPELLSASHKYGDQSFIAKAKKAEAMGVEGEQKLKKLDEGKKAVMDAIDEDISKFDGGARLDPITAGEKLRDSYNQAIDNLFSQNETRYSNLPEKLGTTTIPEEVAGELASKVGELKQGIEKRLKYVADGTPQKSELGATLKQLDVVGSNVARGDLPTLVEQMQELGKMAYKDAAPVAGMSNPDKKMLKNVYSMLQDAVVKSAESVDARAGTQVASDLKKSNEAISDFLKKNAPIKNALESAKVSPEQLYTTLIERGNSTNIRAVKELLKDQPEVLGQLKGAYLDRLKTLDKDNNFTFGTMGRALRNNDSTIRVAKELFEPGELNNFNDLVKLGENFGGPLNPPATAHALQFHNIKDSILNSAVNSGLIEMMEQKAAEKAAKAAQVAKEAAPVADVATSALPATVEESLAQKAKQFLTPNKKDAFIKASQLAATQSHKTVEEMDVPPQLQDEARARIRNTNLSVVEKAQALDRLNRRGKIDMNLLGQFRPAPEPAPAPIPTPAPKPAPSASQMTDYFKNMKQEDF